MRRALGTLPELVDVNTDQEDRGIQTSLVIDRDTASRMGITTRMVDTTLNNAFGQRIVSTIYNPLNQYRVVMEAAPEFWQDQAFKLRGPTALPGCGDLCFRFHGTIAEAEAMLRDAGLTPEFGPVKQRGGADGGQRQGESIYVRDPDGNLLEFMTYPE